MSHYRIELVDVMNCEVVEAFEWHGDQKHVVEYFLKKRDEENPDWSVYLFNADGHMVRCWDGAKYVNADKYRFAMGSYNSYVEAGIYAPPEPTYFRGDALTGATFGGKKSTKRKWVSNAHSPWSD